MPKHRVDAMEDALYEGLFNYLNQIGIAGYVKYKEVDNLLAALFLYSVLSNEFITEEEGIKILAAIKKLSECSCLIPYFTLDICQCLKKT